MKKEYREAFVFWLAAGSSAFSIIAFFALTFAEAYVRWSVNKEFTFLGGFGLVACAFLAAALMAVLAFVLRNAR